MNYICYIVNSLKWTVFHRLALSTHIRSVSQGLVLFIVYLKLSGERTKESERLVYVKPFFFSRYFKEKIKAEHLCKQELELENMHTIAHCLLRAHYYTHSSVACTDNNDLFEKSRIKEC